MIGVLNAHPAAGDRGVAAAVHARARPAARPDRGRRDAARGRQHHERRPRDRLVLVRARRRPRRLGGVGRARRDLRHERRRRVHAARDPADREALGRARRDRRPGRRLPRDRRARAAGAAAGDARRERADDGALAGGGRLRADGVGDRPLVADGRLAGRDPARLERGHPGVPLGREGDRDDDDVLGAARLRRDRAPPRRPRPAPGRWREPRQPALRRGRPRDPDREPHGGGEEGQPRLPGLPRERLQRDADPRAHVLGGRARALRLQPGEAARRAAARAPRRHLPAHARRALRVRARPDRVRRAAGHDEGPARDLRDVLELRRGRAPLGARAGRHARGAAQARPAVRPDRARARATRPRPYEIVVLSDHGQTQGATFKQRNGYGLDELVERSLAARHGRRRRRRRRAELDGRPRLQRGDRHEGEGREAQEERRLRPGRRRDGLRQPRPRLPDGGEAGASRSRR